MNLPLYSLTTKLVKHWTSCTENARVSQLWSSITQFWRAIIQAKCAKAASQRDWRVICTALFQAVGLLVFCREEITCWMHFGLGWLSRAAHALMSFLWEDRAKSQLSYPVQTAINSSAAFALGIEMSEILSLKPYGSGKVKHHTRACEYVNGGVFIYRPPQ